MNWDTVFTVVLFLIGLGMIIKGGDIFVDAATWMAEVSGIPKFIVGATIVSVATTLPELFASVFATMEGSPEIAIGNAVGSVTANTGMIMAVSIIFTPLVIKRRELALKALLMIGAISALTILCFDGELLVLEALLLLLLLVFYIVENVYSASKTKEDDERPEFTGKVLAINLVKFLIGAAALAFGSNLLVDNGQKLAIMLGVPERIIAITLIAIGTSLPELVTAITSLVKKQGSMSVGNIVGANIIDITLILPLCSLISGGALTVPKASFAVDMPICLAIGAIALVPTVIFKRFSRVQGVLMLAIYIAYLVYSVLM